MRIIGLKFARSHLVVVHDLVEMSFVHLVQKSKLQYCESARLLFRPLGVVEHAAKRINSLPNILATRVNAVQYEWSGHIIFFFVSDSAPSIGKSAMRPYPVHSREKGSDGIDYHNKLGWKPRSTV